jgi:hypothetical protein
MFDRFHPFVLISDFFCDPGVEGIGNIPCSAADLHVEVSFLEEFASLSSCPVVLLLPCPWFLGILSI